MLLHILHCCSIPNLLNEAIDSKLILPANFFGFETLVDELDGVQQKGLHLVPLLKDYGRQPFHVAHLLRLELHQLAEPLRVELDLRQLPAVGLLQRVPFLLKGLHTLR